MTKPNIEAECATALRVDVRATIVDRMIRSTRARLEDDRVEHPLVTQVAYHGIADIDFSIRDAIDSIS